MMWVNGVPTYYTQFEDSFRKRDSAKSLNSTNVIDVLMPALSNASFLKNLSTTAIESTVIFNNTLDYDTLEEISTSSAVSGFGEELLATSASFEVRSNASTSFESTLNSNLLAVVLAFFCMATVFGNVLVMVAVAREPYLHTVTNYFIASLATADCIVGAVVMPFCVVLEVGDNYWPFGQDWCDIWRSIDVLASTASILNLCVISLDRYWAITDPMSYPSKMTPARAGVLIALVWICSSLISFPAIAWWRAVSVGPPVPNRCLFTEDVGYLVFSSAVSFYVPLTVMVFTYYKIYRAAVEQKRSLKMGTKQVHSVNGTHCASLTLRIHRGGVLTRHLKTTFADSNGHSSSNDSTLHEDSTERSSLRVPTRQLKAFSLSRKISKLAKERKAAKTLGIVMGVFILCWLPFFVTNVLLGVCGDRCVMNSELVFSVVTWLGWTNSGMNPVIYACWSRDFRRAFVKLLCFCCPKYFRGRQRRRSRFRRVVKDELPSPQMRTSSSTLTKDVRL